MPDMIDFKEKTRELIDDLKSVCANYGLGNDGNEFKIITQVFLYKFLNDKFIYEAKQIDSSLTEEKLSSFNDDDYEMLTIQLNENTAILKPKQFISSLANRQNEANFSDLFDTTLIKIANQNSSLFSVKTSGGEKVAVFENISKYVTDDKDKFCIAIINKITGFSFEHIFEEKFDFYASIFEYLIKDYNSDSGGKYAEYFTPHAVAKIMAQCLVSKDASNATCYDPSAGSGSLLMNLAHQIGEDKCTIYTQDISQKSSHLLRLNLILNNLVHSIPNVVQGNTILHPDNVKKDQKFDYIVSNPPFKLDFSGFRNDLDTKKNNERFFAGIPKTPPTKKGKKSMAIYLLFIQHIIFSLKDKGKAAIVVPTGFITAQKGIGYKIREKLIYHKMLNGVITMPSNIFAATNTNVSVIYISKENQDNIVLIDASHLGETIKEGKNKKTVLTPKEENKIINTFLNKDTIEDFSVVVSNNDIKNKNYSFSAGQYFDIKIEHIDITKEEFENKINKCQNNLDELYKESKLLQEEIKNNFEKLNYE